MKKMTVLLAWNIPFPYGNETEIASKVGFSNISNFEYSPDDSDVPYVILEDTSLSSEEVFDAINSLVDYVGFSHVHDVGRDFKHEVQIDYITIGGLPIQVYSSTIELDGYEIKAYFITNIQP